MNARARIVGTGSFMPEKIMTNHDLEKIVDTSDEWITTRTGIRERRIAGPDEPSSVMGAKAALNALEDAGVSAQDIDMVLVATMSPDYFMPSTAALIQAKIGAVKAGAIDAEAACTGFIYALSVAKAYIESGMYQNILVVGVEKLTPLLNYEDRNTCVLFGDGAAAAVVSNQGAGLALDSICLGADGELGDLLIIPGGGCRHPATHESVDQKLHTVRMDGKEIFKHAVRKMTASAQECLTKAGLTDKDIDWMVPHQANIRIIEAIAKNFSLPEDKVYKTLHKYGNTSAASVAIALDELLKEVQLVKDQRILLVAFGGGLTWGASVLTRIES
ncbi:MAG: 3-oxoacyl-ACP synthase [Chlamydiales bacterium 38-26]|nr:ketoacyl-ACP synthase III [Chlamydiales bacterium]OJV08417.1 MAG: 3-oxoacyl-ACP synthase [Chlamydiales bacterium 38-26]